MFKKNKKAESFWLNFFSLALILTLCSIFVYSLIRIYKEKGKILKEIAILEKRQKELLAEKEKLSEFYSKQKSETYLEGKLRKEGYIKQGEIPVVILPPENQTKEEKSSQIQKEGFFEKIKKFFQNFLRD